MNILVYKRTHTGDPGPSGCFGIYDCMGIARDRDYDAVIGVGGIGPEAKENGIAGMVNWIGLGPHKTYTDHKRGPEVTFEHFVYYGDDGPDFELNAPVLAERMYGRNVRSVLHGLTEDEYKEARQIVAFAEDAPPSLAIGTDEGNPVDLNRCKRHGRTIRCKPKKGPGIC